MGKKFNAIAWCIVVFLPMIFYELDFSTKWFWAISITACIPALISVMEYNDKE